MAGPSGRYPCCGQQAFRYETLPGPMVCRCRISFSVPVLSYAVKFSFFLTQTLKGCQYREHTVLTDSDRDRAILSLVHLAEIGGCLYEAAPTRVNGGSVNDSWWNGITLGITFNEM